MGARANIIVVQSGAYDLYYCHWCAPSLPADLFWGPAYAVAYARTQLDARTLGPETPMRRADLSHPSQARAPDAAGWLDDVWSEGGALIDLDAQILLLWGGDSLSWEIPLRRLYLQLLQEMWQGWDVRWANRGIVDMAECVGLPKHQVLARKIQPLSASDLVALIGYRPCRAIGSMALEDGTLRLYPMGGILELQFAAGTILVDGMRERPGHDMLPLDEWDVSFPRAGFHEDLRQRCLEYWVGGSQWILKPTSAPPGLAGG